MIRQFALWGGLAVSSVLLLAGCSKAPVELKSAQIVASLDKGSGNFDRVLMVCFDQPLTSDYYHKVTIMTKEAVKIQGEGTLRPLASDPDNKCQLRNVYTYINKNSPVGARELIKDYVVPGNISQILVQIYEDKPEGKERPISERVFKNL